MGQSRHSDKLALFADINPNEFNVANKLLKLDADAKTPLAQVPEHGAAKHTNITRELFLSPTGYTMGTIARYNAYTAYLLQDAAVTQGSFNFKVPDDFVSFVSAKAIWMCEGNGGNMWWNLEAQYCAAGELNQNHIDAPAVGATANIGGEDFNVQEPANPLTLASLAIGDYVGLEINRVATNALDTLDEDVWVFGLLFTYIGNQ